MSKHKIVDVACYSVRAAARLLFILTLVLALGGSRIITAQKANAVSLISINSARTDGGNDESLINSIVPRSAVSADGRYVVFQSKASDLASEVRDTNFASDIFVRDLQAGTTTLVSINQTGSATANGQSTSPILSSNGRFVAFESSATDLVAGESNGGRHIFVRDLQLGVTKLVTANLEGRPSNGGLFFLSLFGISADGRYVLFASEASDLVSNDTDGSGDLFVRDTVEARTILISTNRAGVASGNRSALTSSGFFSFDPVMSADGRFVAFTSYVNDLVENDTVCFGRCDGTNGLKDVFVRDLVDSTTKLVSVSSAGVSGGNGFSDSPSISADGKRVAFRSFATDLVTNDRTENADIYVRNTETGITSLVSVNRAGLNGGTDGRGNGLNSSQPIISADGRFVSFSSSAVDLAANKTNLLTTDVFVRDLDAGATTLASVNLDGTDSASNSDNLFGSVASDFSADGRYLAFTSSSPDLVANDSNRRNDVFVRDLMTGVTILASVNRASTGSADGTSLTADVSGDGQVVVFDSDSSNLVESDGNNSVDVFALAISASAPPRITRVKYKSSGKLIVEGENFDTMARLFIDGQEFPAKNEGGGKLVAKKLALDTGSHEARVVNTDGQPSSRSFIVR